MAGPYYIRKTGSDAANGLTPATAWLTIQKAHNAGAGPANGEIVYVGAGTYRETVAANMTSPTAELQFIADVDGSKTGDAGQVIWTAYTTNDTTTPSTLPALDLNARDFLTYEGFYLVGGRGTPSCVDARTATSTNLTFRRCAFAGNSGSAQRCFIYTGAAGVAANLTFDSCVLFQGHNAAGIDLLLPTHTVDWDAVIVIKNCLFIAGTGWGVEAESSGAAAGKPGGVVILNSTVLGGTYGFLSTTTMSTTIPNLVYNSLFLNQQIALRGAVAGQLVEDYNILNAQTPRTNVNVGTHSKDSGVYAALLDLSYAGLNGFLPRFFMGPLNGSMPQLGFGNQGSPAPPTVDLFNRPRPAGGGSTLNGVGALERHDTAVKETSVTDAGGVGLKIIGPGDHDFRVPVGAALTALTIRVRYDTNHGTGNKPQAILLAAPDIGVTTATQTAAAGVDTWETLTFTPFTPTAKGYVVVRLVSRAAAGTGIAYFDTMVAPDLDLGDFAFFSRGEPLPSVSGVTPAGAGIKRQVALTGGVGG